jgi:hypothetical protein
MLLLFPHVFLSLARGTLAIIMQATQRSEREALPTFKWTNKAIPPCIAVFRSGVD